MKNDINNLKKLVHEIIDKGADVDRIQKDNKQLMETLHENTGEYIEPAEAEKAQASAGKEENPTIEDTEEYIEESLSLQDKEIELIRKALNKHDGKRKYAAQDLGISERTLYRKIKEYNLE
jgi:transcriptional regulator with PAS, ATPase and Fis domain